MVKIGFCQPGMGWTYDQMRDFWVEGDKLGFDSGTMMDNLIYTGPPDGAVRPTFETWTFLPAIAALTSNIRIGPQVTPCLRRAPALFAKATTQTDHISNGRVFVGMGVGDMPKYHLPWGMPFPEKLSERAKILREEIEVMKLMWTEEKASYEGNFYTLNDAEMIPKPIQKPHPPIYIGLSFGTKIMPRLAAELTDGVAIYNGSHQATKDLLAVVEGHCEAVGRDYSAFYKSVTVDVILLDDANDRAYLEWPGGIPASLPLYPPPRELLPEYNSVSLKEQLEFLRSIFAAGGAPDEVAKVLPAGVEAPRDGYNIGSMANRYVIGTPGQVVEELKQIAALGVDELCIQGLDSIDALRRFAQEVMPKVRG